MNPKKPGHDKTDALLDELDSVKSLLGDAADDKPAAKLEEHDDLFSGFEEPTASANAQIDTQSGDSSDAFDPNQSVSAQVRKALSERKNPFLATTKQKAVEVEPSPPAKQTTASPAPDTEQKTLSRADIEQAIDELVAEQLPKLEAVLKARLRKKLLK